MRLLPLLLLAAMPAWAQDNTVSIAVDPRACRTLPEAPRGAEYTPGVDVHGRPVVPAEGPGGSGPDWTAAARNTTIAIEIDLAKRLGLADNGSGFVPKAQVGQVTFQDGIVRFNGQPLEGQEKATLRELCRRLEALNAAAGTRKPTPGR